MYIAFLKNKRKAGISIFCILVLLTGLSGCGTKNQIQDKVKITVIVKSTQSNFWKTVKNGVNTAAVEYNVNALFEGPKNEEDFEMQNQMIASAVSDGSDAIVLSAIDRSASVDVLEDAMKQGVHVVIIDSGVDSEKIEAEISTDNYEAGKMAAKPVLERKEEHLKIGIVNFDKNSANGQQREKGFRDMVQADHRVKLYDTVNVESNIKSSVKGTKELLAAHPDLNTIVTFNEWTTLGVGYAIRELKKGDEIQVIGFDNNVVSVDMLETGEVDGLIVQNPFAEGYLGIENAYHLVKSTQKPGAKITTDTTLITKKNRFDKESQKILFPLDSKN